MLTERYQDRLLGGNRLVDVDVRAQWIFTANNIRMSGELVRRCMMIELDAKMTNPEERTSFKHGDILKYVHENRGEIVWACLTLIKNWIVAGAKPHTGPALGNFTEWSQKMGGVLAAARIDGFLSNRDNFRSYAQAEGEGEVQTLMNTLASYAVGTIFRPNGTSGLQREGDKKLHGTKDAQSLLDVLNSANNGSPLLIDGWGYKQRSTS